MEKIRIIIYNIKLKIKQRFCKHEFKGNEMQPRNSDGMVKWTCYKCDKMFVADHGLEILKHGKCIGDW